MNDPAPQPPPSPIEMQLRETMAANKIIEQENICLRNQLVDAQLELKDVATKFGEAQNNVTRSGRKIMQLQDEIKNLNLSHSRQLAAISTAAISNTRETAASNRIDRSHSAWTQAYQDVLGAVEREMSLREKLASSHFSDQVANSLHKQVAEQNEKLRQYEKVLVDVSMSLGPVVFLSFHNTFTGSVHFERLPNAVEKMARNHQAFQESVGFIEERLDQLKLRSEEPLDSPERFAAYLVHVLFELSRHIKHLDDKWKATFKQLSDAQSRLINTEATVEKEKASKLEIIPDDTACEPPVGVPYPTFEMFGTHWNPFKTIGSINPANHPKEFKGRLITILRYTPEFWDYTTATAQYENIIWDSPNIIGWKVVG